MKIENDFLFDLSLRHADMLKKSMLLRYQLSVCLLYKSDLLNFSALWV